MSEASRGRVLSGRLAVGALLLLGALAVAVAMTFHYRSQARPLALWGPEVAQLLLTAPRVELLLLSPPSELEGGSDAATEALVCNDRFLAITDRYDITQARGMVNVRQGLINDRTFDWEAPLGARGVTFTHALRFREGEQSATLLIDFRARQMHLLETGAEVCFAPVAEGLRKFVDEQVKR